MINTSQVSTLNWQVYLCKSSLLKGAMGIFHLTLPSIPISVKYQEFSYFKVDPLKIGSLVPEIVLLELPDSKRTSKFTDPGFQMRSPNPKITLRRLLIFQSITGLLTSKLSCDWLKAKICIKYRKHGSSSFSHKYIQLCVLII